MKLIYTAQVYVPCHNSSIIVTQEFFKTICREFKIPHKTELHLELAIEEAMVGLLKNTDHQGLKDQIRVLVEVFADLIKISMKIKGRPFDFSQIPKYSPDDSAESKIDPLSFGVFVLESAVDDIQWRYVEKEGQEVVVSKKLPEVLAAEAETDFSEQKSAEPLEFTPQNISCRRVRDYQDAVALACCAYDISGYDHRPVLYYPQELLSKMESGHVESLIAIDSNNGVVFGHYALFRPNADDKVAELGAAFVRPECRKGGVFNQLALKLHEHAFSLGLEGVYSLSTTDHIVTQKMSEKYNRLTTAIRLAFFPPIFVGDGIDERAAGALNYRPLSKRAKRDVFVPVQYREIVLATYKTLNIDVNLVDVAETETILAKRQTSPDEAAADNYFDCRRDLSWNKAAVSAAGNDIIAHKIQAMTDILKESKVVSIMLSLDLESPYTPMLAQEAAKLGYFYSGLFPSSFKDGHDALEMQFLNGLSIDPDKIILYQSSGKEIMNFIRQEAKHVFMPAK